MRPNVFLCHGSEDRALAERIARVFKEEGIDVFYSEWEIQPGDNIVSKIEGGLASCTHFVALLTPTSICKRWVRAELSTGTIKMIEQNAKLIPIRVGVGVEDLPELLRALSSPELLGKTDDAIRDLARSVHGITDKPETAPLPPYAEAVPEFSDWELSPAAARIVEHALRSSKTGIPRSTDLSVKELRETLDLTYEEIGIAVDELEDAFLVEPDPTTGYPELGYGWIRLDESFFVDLDPFVMGWDPRVDAHRLATEVLNGGSDTGDIREILPRLGWDKRRLNPAVDYLRLNDLAEVEGPFDPPGYPDWIMIMRRGKRFQRAGPENW